MIGCVFSCDCSCESRLFAFFFVSFCCKSMADSDMSAIPAIYIAFPVSSASNANSYTKKATFFPMQRGENRNKTLFFNVFCFFGSCVFCFLLQKHGRFRYQLSAIPAIYIAFPVSSASNANSYTKKATVFPCKE